MELNKIITPKVGKCFREKGLNGSSQKLIVIGKDLSIGIVECLLLNGSYSYAYAYMDEINEKAENLQIISKLRYTLPFYSQRSHPA